MDENPTQAACRQATSRVWDGDGGALDDTFDVIDAWRKASAMPLTTELTTAQSDRAAGVLVAMACGDALGAGYEFGPPLGADAEVVMEGADPSAGLPASGPTTRRWLWPSPK